MLNLGFVSAILADNSFVVNWRDFFSALTSVKYRGQVCIEVEDKAFEGSPEDVTAAILTSRNYLSQFLVC